MTVLDDHRLVPLAAPKNAAQTSALGDGLSAGGIGIVEVALRTPYALQAIATLAEESSLVVGAGTVLDVDQAEQALDRGASFLVSPGLSASVVRFAADRGIPVLPGVLTPTEVMVARDLGLQRLKVFPAAVGGGLALLDALASVFPDISFMPSGGVSASTLGDHLAHPSVFAVSGSWLAAPALLDQGADAVAKVAAEAVAIAENVA